MAIEIIPPNRSPYSKNPNHYFETACKDCGARQMRRSDAIKKWNGRCRKCASKINNTRPEISAQRAANRRKTISEWPEEKKQTYAEKARQQVIRQGGIPNAKPFVAEGVKGRRMAGQSHYAWKGGVTRQNRKGRCSRQAAAWRQAVLKRDDYTCQFCGVRGGKLHADHILPWSTHIESRFEISNGRTLCIPCHKTTPSYGWRGLKLAHAVNHVPIPS